LLTVLALCHIGQRAARFILAGTGELLDQVGHWGITRPSRAGTGELLDQVGGWGITRPSRAGTGELLDQVGSGSKRSGPQPQGGVAGVRGSGI